MIDWVKACDGPIAAAEIQRAEVLLARFIAGEFRGWLGGFPSVAFHDGYHNYTARMRWWSSSERRDRALAEFAAGALARAIERRVDDL